MTASYEIVEIRVKCPKWEKRRRRRRHLRGEVIGGVVVAIALVLLAAIMVARAMCQEPSAITVVEVEAPLIQPEPPPPAVTQEPVHTMEPVYEEPEIEDRYIVYDVPLSEELQHYAQDVCEEYGVSFPLVIAIMEHESEFLPGVVSATNDYGIMQINQGNHEWLEGKLGITDWFDPQQNILAGVYMLSQFNGYEDVHQILMSYNCGPGGAKKLWAEGVYSTAYSRAVVEILDGLEVMENG